jgi:hypothetical protein
MFDRADHIPITPLAAAKTRRHVCLDEALLVSKMCSSLFAIQGQSARQLDAIALASGGRKNR